MDIVSPVQSNTTNAASGNTSGVTRTNNTVNYDAFLSLLVAQLKNQDPTAPTDSGEFLSQLASFSSVEQQIQTNEKLNTLLKSNELGQAANLIDRQITSADGTITGVIVAVTLTDSGAVAKLENGLLVAIEDGITVHR